MTSFAPFFDTGRQYVIHKNNKSIEMVHNWVGGEMPSVSRALGHAVVDSYPTTYRRKRYYLGTVTSITPDVLFRPDSY